MGIWSTDYIPRGTRFGPLVGKRYAKDEVPKTANRKYFWRVSIQVFLWVRCFGWFSGFSGSFSGAGVL